MSTQRQSLPLWILGRLTRGAIPVDGFYGWEPSGALKFTTRPATGGQPREHGLIECARVCTAEGRGA